MHAIDPEVARRVRQWIDYAEEDLRLGRHALALARGCPYRLVAFHAQQCAEKYLKALLVLGGVDFPYTHNIRRLRELCELPGEWPPNFGEIDDLSTFAITARYPGAGAEVSRDEALAALELASRARDVIRKSLEQRGIQTASESGG